MNHEGKNAQEQGGEGRGTALSPRGQEFRPTALMEKALSVAIENPGIKPPELAALGGLDVTTFYNWRRDPRFRRWWADCIASVARDAVPDMLLELQRLVHSDDVAPGVKAKLVDTIVKSIPPTDAKESVGAALMEILHRWNPNTYRASLEANHLRVKAQVDAVLPAERDKNATTDTPTRGLPDAVATVHRNMRAGIVRVLEEAEADPTKGGHSYGGEHSPPSLRPRGDGGAKSQREPEKADEPRPYAPPKNSHTFRDGVCIGCGDPEATARRQCPRPDRPADRGVYRILRRDEERQGPSMPP